MSKKEFVDNLSTFLVSNNVMRDINLHHLDYVDTGDDEWVYVFVGEHGASQKRVCVSCDSTQAIMINLFKMFGHWDRYDYILPNSDGCWERVNA